MSRTEPASGQRVRHVYTITESGRQVLQGWLAQPAAPWAVRNELLLKLFFGRQVDGEAIKAHLVREREQARGAMMGTAAAIGMLETEQADAPDLAYWLLTLDMGRRWAEARLEWAEAGLRRLELPE